MGKNKPHVNIGVIGHTDHSKTTLTAAIEKYLKEKNEGSLEEKETVEEVIMLKSKGISNYVGSVITGRRFCLFRKDISGKASLNRKEATNDRPLERILRPKKAARQSRYK